MLAITRVHQETPNVRTYTFRYQLGSAPGQFVMLWVPGVDQKPFSIGNDTGEEFSLTIYALGTATKTLFEMGKGDRFGISGPYGTSYTYAPESHLITVGGGYGAAPLGYLTERARIDGCTVDFVLGARSKSDVLFEQRAQRAGAIVHVATDDGSRGEKGYNTVILKELLEERKRSRALANVKVFACGPELMQLTVARLCADYHVPCELSIERYMKCGFGICGNCCVDDTGAATCINGTVISGAAALKLKEFGQYHRSKTGQRLSFHS